MFSQIWNFIVSIWEQLNPFIIINEYQQGLILRLGKFSKIIQKGLHFKIPFVDEVIKQHIVITTLNLSAQSLYTKDRQNIVVRSIIKYKISDVKVFLMEVYDSIDALGDITQGVIKNIIMEKTFEECLSSELDNCISKKVRNESKKFGIHVEQVTLSDIGPLKTIRLMNENSNIQLN